MALIDLTDEEKIAVSRAWVTEGSRDRRFIESHPALKIIFATLLSAHEQLVSAVRTTGTVAELLAILTQEITTYDGTHDRKGRGIHLVISGLIELADDPQQARQLLALLELLYPEGLNVIRSNYRNQVGTAEKVRQKLDPKTFELLGTIKYGERTLSDDVHTWLDAAATLGDKIVERAKLVGDQDDAVTRGDVYRAGLAWIKAVNDLLDLVRIARLAPDEERMLLADLREADRKATLRRTRAASPQVDASAPAEDAESAVDADQPVVTDVTEPA